MTELKQKAVEILKTGTAEEWNKFISDWRDKNPGEMFDLAGVNLEGSDLTNSDLRYCDLRYCNLNGANLTGVKLEGATLDFSSFSLNCGALKQKTDIKQRRQLMFHALSLIKHADNATEEEKQILEYVKPYANEFHRVTVYKDVEKL